MARPFLTARWENLILANYRVPPELLEPYVPPGSVLDTPDDAPGLHLLSLVAFHFAATRVYGIPIPTAQWFPEINLRFYVRQAEKRAVVFLREFVPTPIIVLGARLLYHQPYYLATIAHQLRTTKEEIQVYTRFRHGSHTGEIRVRARNEPWIPPASSQEHFLKEHYWGFDRTPSGAGFRYQVDHPVWNTFPVEDATITFDPGAILGGGVWQSIDWNASLHSVLFAEGSAVTVYGAEPL
jgi:uncharacterized protein YqjF (DUF2071 family)